MRNFVRCSCLLCKNEITVGGLINHYASKACLSGSVGIKVEPVPEDFCCCFCGKICKNLISYRSHTRMCIKNENRTLVSGMTGKVSPNKGKTKETDEWIMRATQKRKSTIENGEYTPHRTPHSEETKSKLREIRRKYLEENPDKAGYALNHYSRGESYPEGYWREVLENAGISFEQEKRVGLYRLDFAINGNIDLEIDGEQHYSDKRIIDSDIRRTEKLRSSGWMVIRIRWSEYKSLSKEYQREYTEKIIESLKISGQI